jgi:hypothetical protein
MVTQLRLIRLDVFFYTLFFQFCKSDELLVEKHNLSLKNLFFQVFLDFLSQKWREKFPHPTLK